VPWPAGTLQSSVAALELATGTLQEEIVDLKNAVDAALLGKEEAREQAAALEAQLSDSLSSKVELEEQASAIGKQLAQAQADADAARTRAEAAAGAARLRIVDLLRDGASNGELLTESRHAQMAFEAECSAALAKASALAWDCSTLQCLGGEREAMCAWLRGLLQKEREKLKSIEVVHLDAMEKLGVALAESETERHSLSTKLSEEQSHCQRQAVQLDTAGDAMRGMFDATEAQQRAAVEFRRAYNALAAADDGVSVACEALAHNIVALAPVAAEALDVIALETVAEEAMESTLRTLVVDPSRAPALLPPIRLKSFIAVLDSAAPDDKVLVIKAITLILTKPPPRELERACATSFTFVNNYVQSLVGAMRFMSAHECRVVADYDSYTPPPGVARLGRDRLVALLAYAAG